MQDVFQEAHKVSLNAFFQSTTGVRPTRQTRTHVAYSYCPNCGQSERTSDKFSVQNDAFFHCFSCDCSGDVITLAVALWGCSRLEAARRLTGTADTPNTPTLPKAQEPVVQDPERKIVLQRVLMIIGQIALDWARTGDTRPHRQYLHGRGFSDATIDAALQRQMMAFLPEDSQTLTQLLVQEIGRPMLEKAGIWKPEKRMPGIINRPIVLFFAGVQSAEFCRIRPNPQLSKRIRYGSTDFPYFWKGTGNTNVVGITEGFFDLLSLVELDPTNDVLGIPGTSAWTESMFTRFAAQFPQPKTFHLWLDGDTAGRTSAKAMADCLTRLQLPFHDHPLPEGMDLNDFLVSKRRVA